MKEQTEKGLMCLEAAYAGNPEEAEEWKAELESQFPGMPVHMDPLSLSVACHIGRALLQWQFQKKWKWSKST